jgi:pimeloyl-ACP methyl ester carboxylesterase
MVVALPESVTSQTVDLAGPTHYFDFGGPASAQTIVGVHGLGGAAWNWAAVAPYLTEHYRLLSIDLAGHGRTPAAGRKTTVAANRRLLDQFIRTVVGQPVVLMGNSMGGAISLLEAAASPALVRGAVLVNPALPRPVLAPIDPTVAASFLIMSLPGLGEAAMNRRRRRRTAEQQVHETLTLCCVDPSRIPPDVVRLGIAMAEERYGNAENAADFLMAARSLVRMLGASRKFRRVMASVNAPVLLIHGDRDRLVSARVADEVAQANPHWRYEIARGVGHVPQLEAPEWTASVVLDWLASMQKVSSSSTR